MRRLTMTHFYWVRTFVSSIDFHPQKTERDPLSVSRFMSDIFMACLSGIKITCGSFPNPPSLFIHCVTIHLGLQLFLRCSKRINTDSDSSSRSDKVPC